MDLKIFGFSCRLEVIIICLVIGFILGAHLLCSCSKIGLQEGMAMFMFADNKFKPECCPSTYTSSTGCACISQEQVNYINQRGGNRTMAPAEF